MLLRAPKIQTDAAGESAFHAFGLLYFSMARHAMQEGRQLIPSNTAPWRNREYDQRCTASVGAVSMNPLPGNRSDTPAAISSTAPAEPKAIQWVP